LGEGENRSKGEWRQPLRQKNRKGGRAPVSDDGFYQIASKVGIYILGQELQREGIMEGEKRTADERLAVGEIGSWGFSPAHGVGDALWSTRRVSSLVEEPHPSWKSRSGKRVVGLHIFWRESDRTRSTLGGNNTRREMQGEGTVSN